MADTSEEVGVVVRADQVEGQRRRDMTVVVSGVVDMVMVDTQWKT